VLEGSGPAGATLRLSKTFKTETFPQPPDDQPILFDDKLETVYDIGSDGRVRWHVNPSTRPLVAKETGVPDPGEPSPPITQTGGVAGSSTTEDDPDDGATSAGDPVGGANSNDPAHYNDHPITVPSTGDNATMSVRVSWASPASDWDVKLYEDTNGDSRSQNDEPVVGTSQTGPGNVEEVSASGQPRLEPGKKYVLRVNNFAATEGYDVEITFQPPLPFKPAQVESYTLTCEVGGQVLDTQQVQVDRGETRQLDLSACGRTAGETPSLLCAGKTGTIFGTAAVDRLKGTRGRDVIVGLGGNDVIRGLRGNDLVCGGAGRDRLVGGAGKDSLRGNGGKDKLRGNGGKDKLRGAGGGDVLRGQAGRDRLFGGRGRDRLFGGPARDRLRGGPGRDSQRQ
jgi:hypothetical protein